MIGHPWGTSVTTVSQLSGSNLSDFGNATLRMGKRASAIALVIGLAACSTAPEWAKPGLIYGDDAAAASADATVERDFPELADVPDKPAPSSTVAERRQAAEGLAADRERARYTDEVLRGGTEAPAQAPRSAAPAPAPVIAAPAPIAPTPIASVPVDNTGVIPLPPRGGRAQPSSAATTAEVPQNRGSETQAVEIVPNAPAPVASTPVASAPIAPVPTAPEPVTARAPIATPAPVARRAAVPALPESERVARAQRTESQIDERLTQIDAAAASTQRVISPVAARVAAPVATAVASAPVASGQRANDRFEASTAPALAHEALEAAGPIVSSRYGTPASTTIGSADPEDPVEVNLDALRGIGPGASLQPFVGPNFTAAFANQGGPGNIPPYVVSFGHGSTQLNADDRLKVAQAANAARSQGGVVRVVGHASSRTGDLAVGRHVLANFKASLDRATAVANELIQNGVDPSRVFVEAKGDAVPVYYESMPAGEAGNRRAEIFIE